jgi:serine phosphatase RsbU (regulator of sigma subunit)
MLPDLLEAHVPGMFPGCNIEICLFPEQVLLARPPDLMCLDEGVWEWVRTTREPHLFAPGAPLPWGGQQRGGETLLLAPILGVEGAEPLGGIYIEQGRTSGVLASSASLIQSLAAQITSAYHSAQTRAQTQEQRRIAQELLLAGRIQASLLPAHPPKLPGWQIAAALDPARETSGDFYDFIALPGGRWGIVIADVSDKGVGAALFMALSRTLLRNYAAEYPTRADRVLAAVNQRILSEARAGLFVTMFYGILDPETGTLAYANAGHHPPYVLGQASGTEPQVLTRSGMALGVLESERWAQETVALGPADVLLLYTDGVTDALSPQGTAFGVERLLIAARQGPAGSAGEIQAAILAALDRFTGDTPQLDDRPETIIPS